MHPRTLFALLSSSLLMLGVASAAPHVGTVHGLDLQMDAYFTACPDGTVPVDAELARAINRFTDNGLCDFIGESTTIGLADGGAMGGRRYGCPVEASTGGHHVPGLLCVAHTPSPRLRRRQPREIYPGGSGKVLEFSVRALDAAATPMARVYISDAKPPAGWPAQMMAWDAPAGGSAAWLPDGAKMFQMQLVKAHEPSALPTLASNAARYTNQSPPPWKPLAAPVVPQYIVSELGSAAGMSVLPDGTLRFYTPEVPVNATRTLMDQNAKPATFVLNDATKAVVFTSGYQVDDTRTSADGGAVYVPGPF